jgi:predicted ArsR family transcriptional regulator
VFSTLADHTGPRGIARVSAADLAAELGMHPTHVRRDLRALAAGGFVIPLEERDGVLIAATGHPRFRAGYKVPSMVAPAGAGRPHLVR